MKIRQIVNESQDPIKIFKQYFNTTGDIEQTADGLTVRGYVELKENKKIKQIPVQFNMIYGNFDLSTSDRLTTLDNFPREIHGNVYLGSQPDLTSLATPYPVRCGRVFEANGVGITDLTGCQITTHRLLIRSCANLKSLDGLNGRINEIHLDVTSRFEADLMKYNNIDIIRAIVIPHDHIKMPLVRALAFGSFLTTSPLGAYRSLKPAVELVVPDAYSATSIAVGKIIQKYQKKGPENILDIMRDLRDAGFEDAAVL